jgi:hypothetical protein
MAEPSEGVNALQVKYAAAKAVPDEATCRDIIGQIYLQAQYMARSASGGWGHPERERFSGADAKKEKLIHEYLWRGETDHLLRIVNSTLAGFDSSRGSYSNYLIDSIQKMRLNAERYVDAEKRRKRQDESSAPEDYEIATGDAAVYAPGDDELIDRIYAYLKMIPREQMQRYLAVDDTDNGAEVGRGSGVSRQAVHAQGIRTKQRLSELLRPLYEQATSGQADFDSENRRFARCLKLAQDRLKGHYERITDPAKIVYPPAPPHFITVEQLNTHLGRKDTPENILEVALFLDELAETPDRKAEMDRGLPPKIMAEAVGRYMKDKKVQLCCDPAIAYYASKNIKQADLPDNRPDLITCHQFNSHELRRKQSPKNLELLQQYALGLLQSGHYMPGGGEYTGKECRDLMGVYCRSRRTTYLSTTLKAHICKEQDVLPFIDESERKKYYTLTELMAELYAHGNRARKDGSNNVEALQTFLTDLRDKAGQEIVYPNDDKKEELTASQAIIRARFAQGQGDEHLYIRKEILPYVKYNHVEQLKDSEKASWAAAGGVLCEYLHITPTRPRIEATHKLLEEIRASRRDELVPIAGEQKKVGDIIRRFARPRMAPSYYIRKDAAIRTDEEGKMGYKGLINEKMIDAKVVELAEAKLAQPATEVQVGT